MLRYRRINDGVALWHIKMTAWLIQKYGAPLTPPTPKPLDYQTPLHLRFWDKADARLPLEWAQDEFNIICNHMHMGQMNISLIPDMADKDLETGYKQNRTFTGGWQTLTQTRVKLDINSNPVVTYNPKFCHIPGYLSARVIMDLSKIYIGAHQPPEDFDHFFEIPLTLLGAAHLGQGFTLAALSPDLVQSVLVGRDMTSKELKEFTDVVTFVTVLSMACRRLSPEQMIGSFGKIMTPSLRRRIWPMYRNLKRFEEEVEYLRELSGSIIGTASKPQKTFVSHPTNHTQLA